MIKTSLEYSEEVLADFFKFQLIAREKVKWLYYTTSFLSLVIGIVVLVFLKQTYVGIAAIVLSIIMLCIFPLQVKGTIKKQVLSRYKRPDQVIIFSDNNIEQWIDVDRCNKYSWDDIIEVAETNKYLYLYISKYGAIIVQKARVSEKDIATILEMAKAKGIFHKYYKFYYQVKKKTKL